MKRIVDTTLLEIVAEMSRNWNDYRDEFVEYARPVWLKNGGEELVNHMIREYADGTLEKFHRLDDGNQRLLLKWLIQKERGIIAQEIKMYEDDPNWRCWFNLFNSLFIDAPIKHDIAGTVESIQEITPELLYNCYYNYSS